MQYDIYICLRRQRVNIIHISHNMYILQCKKDCKIIFRGDDRLINGKSTVKTQLYLLAMSGWIT